MINIYIITSLNKNNNKQTNIKVLMITLFSFLWRFKSVQSMLHSCLPFDNFFGQIMHFYKLEYVVLTNTYFKPLQKKSLAEAY
jgi:hypothetical protein